MNKHFEDARYYLNRAADTAKEGVKEELEPVRDRFREATGREEDPEPTGLEKVQGQLEEIEGRAEGEARRAITSAKGRIKSYRDSE
jgi:hypothetical protein